MRGAPRSAETFGELSRAAHAEATRNENFSHESFDDAQDRSHEFSRIFSLRPPRLRVRLFSKEFPMSGAHHKE